MDRQNVICGIGYNGFPRGCPDARLPWSKAAESGDPLETKYPYVCHAEMNALLNKNGASVTGAVRGGGGLCWMDPETTSVRHFHARPALREAGRRATGLTFAFHPLCPPAPIFMAQRIYVTMFPCNECAKLMIQAGIAEVVFHEDKGAGAAGGSADPAPGSIRWGGRVSAGCSAQSGPGAYRGVPAHEGVPACRLLVATPHRNLLTDPRPSPAQPEPAVRCLSKAHGHGGGAPAPAPLPSASEAVLGPRPRMRRHHSAALPRAAWAPGGAFETS